MESKTDMGTDIIGQLVRLQQMDRVRDRLQKRLDQIPIKLKEHSGTIARLEAALEEQEQLMKSSRAEADRAELEVKTKEEHREKCKRQMNAPKLTNREYEVLQEALAGVLADINQLTGQALKSLDKVAEAEGNVAAFREELAAARVAYETAKAKLEGGLSDVKEELAKGDAERSEYVASVRAEPLLVYERVRQKHSDALAVVDGTIDRAASRIGNDLHCSACYMTITANDAVKVLEGKQLIRCKSCARILYVP
ncbi:MAG: zinc ribbon domain-containing protein [Planctomycetota bacterium]|jgi:predicted  nucleic acid-binding Zn-ribbon protein